MGAMLEISTDLLRRIMALAAAQPGREVCGLLLGGPERVIGVEPCANVAAKPATTFEIDPVQLIAAHRRARAGGPAIAGCYHSHPRGDATPSERDAEAAPPDGGVWLIVGGGRFAAWRAVADGQLHGRFEPLTMVIAPAT